MARIRTQYIQRRFSTIHLSGKITEFISDNLSNLLVECPQGDLGRARLRTQIAVYAPAGHMNGPGEVKHRIFRREVSCPDENVFLEGTDVAKADGTDVPAAIALDAPVELPQPVGESLGQARHDFLHAFVFDWVGLFTGNVLVRERLATFMIFGQFSRAGQADRHNPLRGSG
jgi:hypothetical protein